MHSVRPTARGPSLTPMSGMARDVANWGLGLLEVIKFNHILMTAGVTMHNLQPRNDFRAVFIPPEGGGGGGGSLHHIQVSHRTRGQGRFSNCTSAIWRVQVWANPVLTFTRGIRYPCSAHRVPGKMQLCKR